MPRRGVLKLEGGSSCSDQGPVPSTGRGALSLPLSVGGGSPLGRGGAPLWELALRLETGGRGAALPSAYKVGFEKQTKPCPRRDEAELRRGFFLGFVE